MSGRKRSGSGGSPPKPRKRGKSGPSSQIAGDVETIPSADIHRAWKLVEERFHAVGPGDKRDLNELKAHRKSLEWITEYQHNFAIPLRNDDESSRAYFKRLRAVYETEKARLERPQILADVERDWGSEVAARIRGTEVSKDDISRAAWNYLSDAFWAKGPSEDTASRYKALYERLMKDIGSIQRPTYLAKTGLDGLTCEQFCDNVEVDLRLAPVNQRWNNAILLAPSQEDADTVEKDYWQMRRDVKAGLAPYNPKESTGARSDKLRRLPLGESFRGNWKWREELGEGVGGYSNVWQCFDDEGKLVDRMAVKEIFMDGGQWNNDFFWEGDMDKRVLRECAIATYLTPRSGSTSIAKPRGFGVYPRYRMARLYSEFCNLGDWKTLVGLYRDKNRMFKRKGEGQFTPIPERAIWSLFEDLASALYTMYQGGETPSQGHRTVLHRDLKPANLFRASQDRETWPKIPKTKVGDFGLSIWLDHADSQTTNDGTIGWFAPECHTYDRKHPLVQDACWGGWDPARYNFPIDERSDVWSVGRIVRYVMLQEQAEGHQSVLFDTASAKLGFEPGDTVRAAMLKPERARTHYPEKLCHLVERCVEQFPDDRIDIKELWEEIQKVVATPDADGNTMKTSPPAEDEFWPVQRDMYLGLADWDPGVYEESTDDDGVITIPDSDDEMSEEVGPYGQ